MPQPELTTMKKVGPPYRTIEFVAWPFRLRKNRLGTCKASTGNIVLCGKGTALGDDSLAFLPMKLQMGNGLSVPADNTQSSCDSIPTRNGLVFPLGSRPSSSNSSFSERMVKMKTIIKALIGLYFNFLYKCAGGEKRPVFYDIEKTAPALRDLDKNYSVIKSEVEHLLDIKKDLPSYHDLDPRQRGISAGGEKKWKVFLLYAMGAKPKANRALCPQTSALLDKVPNLFEAFFSILEAGKSVPAHHGTYYGMIRYHLGLVVPRECTPSIRIKDQFYTWSEGASVLFDDTWEHEVFNESKGDRVVLLVDVLRPLPLPAHMLNLLFVKAVRIAYGSGLLKNLEKLQ